MTLRQLPIPSHFDRRRVGEVWRVPYAERSDAAAAWSDSHDVQPAADDRYRICLLLVDCQNTFCMPGFELFVAGRSGQAAVEDGVRLCEFIYRNLGIVTQTAATLDTHTTMQIFHPVFWIDADGQHPSGGQTIISLRDLEEGAWRINPAVAAGVADGDIDYLRRHALHYIRTLTDGGKYPLLVWPYHAMLGGVGHALVPAVEEALFFHGLARQTQCRFEIKGDNPLTEHYSALHPEVMDGPDGQVLGRKNTSLIEKLFEFDAVIIAGQAKSHCVAWTVHDLLSEIRSTDPLLAGKFYLLEDCTSPVVVPDVIDFSDQADEAFRRFADAGMHIVRSNDPIGSWPGIGS